MSLRIFLFSRKTLFLKQRGKMRPNFIETQIYRILDVRVFLLIGLTKNNSLPTSRIKNV